MKYEVENSCNECSGLMWISNTKIFWGCPVKLLFRVCRRDTVRVLLLTLDCPLLLLTPTVNLRCGFQGLPSYWNPLPYLSTVFTPLLMLYLSNQNLPSKFFFHLNFIAYITWLLCKVVQSARTLGTSCLDRGPRFIRIVSHINFFAPKCPDLV